MKKARTLLALILGLYSVSVGWKHPSISIVQGVRKVEDKYDDLIKEASKDVIDWRLIKAQIWAESNFNPNAVSQAGAEGLAQFMPKTWKQMVKDLKFDKNAKPTDPKYAIPACVYYMNKLNNKWVSERETIDRYMLALASYNAGFGNVLKAQRESGMRVEYGKIIKELPKITGTTNAKQTQDYVLKILRKYIEYSI